MALTLNEKRVNKGIRDMDEYYPDWRNDLGWLINHPTWDAPDMGLVFINHGKYHYQIASSNARARGGRYSDEDNAAVMRYREFTARYTDDQLVSRGILAEGDENRADVMRLWRAAIG